MEKYYTINYLFNKLTPHLPSNNKDEINKEKTMKITKNLTSKKLTKSQILLQSQDPFNRMRRKSIIYFINQFRNYPESLKESNVDIFSIEKEDEIPKLLNNYFNEINNLLKEEKIVKKYNQDELLSIYYDLENYILLKMHDKLLPDFPSKCDEFIYRKCLRLDFIKPEHMNADKKMINENLLLTVTELVNKINGKYTPIDKINMFGKAFQILQDSMSFSSGKSDVGTDDVLPLLHYVMIKAKPKMIYTNYLFCKYYLNPYLLKKQTGFLLAQIGLFIKVICNMKHTHLKGVTEEQFGVEEEKPEDLKDIENKID